MKIPFSFALFSALIFSAQNCSEHSGKTAEPPTPDAIMAPVSLPEGFNEYWYAGKAELCTYEVTQERYGEIRQAEQVNVFVTEDFSRAKQVKLDDPAAAPTDRVPVLKLNLIRRFHTGIYDYSIMQSVFTPVSGLSTLKTTTTVQDWCGQVFMQNNLEKDGYHLRGFSYFESEGDQDLRLPLTLLEDEIWTRIRLNPSALPTGKLSIIPSAIYTRLRHKPGGAQNAEIKIEKGEKESDLKIVYTDIPRALSIRFTTAFPYKILGWEETHEGKIVSKGELKATIRSAYWEAHDNLHAPLRDSLKLRF
ncbi:MAG: septum formation inhibitor Maf [Lewinellaceae bacterium]|nr:septum formation inhibitor Maf [Lewinellaceae bacterium]